MMATACDLSSCPSSLALESKLSRNLEVQYGLVSKLSHHGGKNHRPAGSNTKSVHSQNTVHSGFSVEHSDTVFLPLMMFSVAKQQALMTGLVLRARSQAQSHDSSAMLEEQKHQQRGFECFC